MKSIKCLVFTLALLLVFTGCTKGDRDTVQPANESKSVDFPDLTQSVSNAKTDEAEPDEMEELLSQQPVAVNSGSSHIVNGQWIYIISNINSETADEPAESSFSSYSVKDYI